MRVRVDDRRHHGLAGEVHARRARGHAHVAGAADLREAIPAHDERGVLDRSASVADDDARAFEDGRAGRRLPESGTDHAAITTRTSSITRRIEVASTEANSIRIDGPAKAGHYVGAIPIPKEG